jgi:uncharacterized membrane protein YqgA involved in biofilm formation
MELIMRKLALIALLLAASPALAENTPVTSVADVTVGTVLGTTLADVQTALAAMGYDVRRGEMEDGEIEVYFVADGQMAEVYVNAQTGAVTRLNVN